MPRAYRDACRACIEPVILVSDSAEASRPYGRGGDRDQAFVAGGQEAAASSAPRGAEVRRPDQPAEASSSAGPSSSGNPGAVEAASVPWAPRAGGGPDGPSTNEELPVAFEEIPDVDSEGDIVMNVNQVAKAFDLEIMGIASSEVYKLTGRRNVPDVSEVFS